MTFGIPSEPGMSKLCTAVGFGADHGSYLREWSLASCIDRSLSVTENDPAIVAVIDDSK